MQPRSEDLSNHLCLSFLAKQAARSLLFYFVFLLNFNFISEPTFALNMRHFVFAKINRSTEKVIIYR